ncbi:MAG: hypothetical protein HPY66_1587 [Firmicutes bacterium]|nr:hypothetical protein [Bacillota bacterium]MDI6706060.1 transcriptional regulator GutM [Bacillota bacterium]
MIKLVILAGIAWTLQGVMAYWQYNRFQRKFNELAQSYNIGVGYSRNRSGLGAIVIVAADPEGTIERVEVMKGISVFTGFKKSELCIGESVFGELPRDAEGGGLVYNALKEAAANAKKVMGGDIAAAG